MATEVNSKKDIKILKEEIDSIINSLNLNTEDLCK